MSGTAMAEEIGRLTEKLRVLETRVIESEREADCPDIDVQERLFEKEQTESWLQMLRKLLPRLLPKRWLHRSLVTACRRSWRLE